MTRLLIDSDSLVWSAGAVNAGGPLHYALADVRDTIMGMMTTLGADWCSVFLSDHEKNWRKIKYPDYKSNRKQERPEHFEGIREYLLETCGAIVVPYHEADDVVSVHGFEAWRNEGKDDQLFPQTIVCHIDKDLNQVPGWHWNWKKHQLYYVDHDTAIDWSLIQLCMGDSGDGIAGLKGIGEKKVLSRIIKCDYFDIDVVLDWYKEIYGESWDSAYDKAYDLTTMLSTHEDLKNVLEGIDDNNKKESPLS